MPLSKDHITTLLLGSFPDAEIELTALVDDDDHWALAIKCRSFKGLTRVQQHKKVFEALKGAMNEELHALQLKTMVLED